MPKFKYTAIDQKGKQKVGNLNAASPDEARAKVSSMGLMPVNVEQSSDTKATKSQKTVRSKNKSVGFSFGRIVNSAELATFTRQLATLLQANLPLLRSLEVMIRQERNLRFKVKVPGDGLASPIISRT